MLEVGNNVAVYLAGPINGTTDEEANDWRTRAKELLPDVLDPMTRDYRGKEDESVADIVEGDKADIDSADAMIAYCPKPSVGTSMEVLYCWGKLPCIVVVPPGSPCSPWLRYHANAVVSTIEEAVSFLLALEEGDESRPQGNSRRPQDRRPPWMQTAHRWFAWLESPFTAPLPWRSE